MNRGLDVNEWVDPVERWDHPDAPHRSEADRFAIYAVDNSGLSGRLCETSLSGVGQGVLLMLQENQVPRGARIGVLDRLTRLWLVNPYA